MRTVRPWLPVAVAAIVQWLVVATAPFLPFVDLPQHVAQAQLLLHRHEPAMARLYEAPLVPQINVLGLFVLAPALAVLPEPVAVRSVLALYVGGLAAALYGLTRVLRTSAWTAAAALLFALQFNLWYGFVSFCLGLPILILLVARWAGVNERGSIRGSIAPPRDLAIDAVLWWLLLLAHVLLFGFALGAFALWVAWGPQRAARLQRALAVVPAVGWLAAYAVVTRAVMQRLPSGGGVDALWEGPGAKLAEFGRAMLVATHPGTVEWVVLGAVALGTAVCLRTARRRNLEAPDANRAPASRSQPWLLSVAALAVLAYIVLPYSIYERNRVTYGLFILYPRFVSLAPLFVLPLLRAPASGALRSGLAVAIAAAHLGLALHWNRVLGHVGREAAPLDAAIAALEPGRILKSLVLTPFPAGLRYDGFLHVASYYQARKLGETDQSFAAILPSAVHYRDPLRPYLSLQDEHLRPDAFALERLRLYDYLLLYRRGGMATVGSPPVFARDGWRIEPPPAAAAPASP